MIRRTLQSLSKKKLSIGKITLMKTYHTSCLRTRIESPLPTLTSRLWATRLSTKCSQPWETMDRNRLLTRFLISWTRWTLDSISTHCQAHTIYMISWPWARQAIICDARARKTHKRQPKSRKISVKKHLPSASRLWGTLPIALDRRISSRKSHQLCSKAKKSIQSTIWSPISSWIRMRKQLRSARLE